MFAVAVNLEKLKQSRLALSLSTAYVSKQLGIEPLELEALESGSYQVSEEQLEILAKIYGCPLDYYINDKEDEQVTSHRAIFARNGLELSEFDKNQLSKFLAFQKEISKLKSKN